MLAIPVVIVTGFLGCGKTSFLRHLLPRCAEAHVRPALIINEVGDVGVDGELLADVHADQVQLVGGCVCCTLQPQLSATVHSVLATGAYGIIVIECSGLSNPVDVVAALSIPSLLHHVSVSHIACVVDCSRAERLFGAIEIARSQVISSDVVILNKEDKCVPESRQRVEGAARDLAPGAAMYWATYGDIGHDALLRILTDAAPMHAAVRPHGHAGKHPHELPASFCTVAIELPDPVGREALECMLGSLPDNVIRAKGFANVAGEGWHVVHRVFGETSMTPLGGPGPEIGAILVCIGRHLSPEHIRELCGAGGVPPNNPVRGSSLL